MMDMLITRKGWPCLWEHVSIAMEVGFMAFILIHSGLKWIGVLRDSRSADEDELKKHDDDDLTVTKLSISYFISLSCCVLMVGIHCFVISLMLLSGSSSSLARCDSPVRMFSAEILQVLSWGIASFAVTKTRKKKLVRFPWLLRSWWLCSFLLSTAVFLAFDTHFVSAKHNISLGFREFSDFTSLLASLLLLAISVRGKTDLCFLSSNEIAEPLLKCETDQHERESLYGKATLFQRMNFSWLNPLFSVGYKKPLEKDDIPEIDVKDSARYCSLIFGERLKSTRDREGAGNTSFYKSVCLFVLSTTLWNF